MPERRSERDRPWREQLRTLGPTIANLDGAAVMRTRMYISDQNAEEIAPLEQVRSASIGMSVTSDTSWNLSLEIDRNLTYGDERIPFNPWRDWVKVDAEVWMPDDEEWKTFRRGLYKFDQKAGSHLGTHNTWDLAGYSPEFVLLADGPQRVFKVAKTDNVLKTVKDICVDRLGFDPKRIRFPMSQDTDIGYAKVFDPNQDNETSANWLAICNKLLLHCGFVKIFTDETGRLRTGTLGSMEAPGASMVYGWGLDAEPILIEGIADTFDTANFCNRVIVTSEDPKAKPPIFAVARSQKNHDELGRWVTTRIKHAGIKNNDVAQKMADAYLRRYLMFTRVIQYTTPPDPERSIKEFHRLVMDGEGLPNVEGMFRNMAFEQEIYPFPKAMTFTSVARVDA